MNHIIARHPRPSSADELRERLYGGEIFLSEGSGAARSLAARAMAAVEEAFADADGAPNAQFALSRDDFFGRIKTLRREFYEGAEWRKGVSEVIEAAGFDPGRTAYDPMKLRVVQSGGIDNPAAKAVFGAHRDVWYSHPSCLVTWWVALHDAPKEETFVFYPDHFSEPVPNDSERFDYREWVKDGPDLRIGWQDIRAGRTAVFPSLLDNVFGDASRELGFDVATGDELLFAGAHLHRTLPHRSGRTRFSVDFRVIDLPDTKLGRGARLSDTRCRGSAAPDYLAMEK